MTAVDAPPFEALSATLNAVDRLGAVTFTAPAVPAPALPGTVPSAGVSGALGRPIGRAVKAVFDRIAALALLVLLAPVLLVVTMLVGITSRGPVLFRQTRVGRDGRPFRMLKFRSMHRGAEQHQVDLLDRDEGAGVLFKVRHDPRVTPLGRVLRRYSLDELPQLVNVLAGTMSLVGPRPPLPDEVRRYPVRAHRRLDVKPGLTGLWQVSGRSNLSWEDALRLDLRYVEDWSLAMDAAVLIKTVRAVLSTEGAY